MNILEPHQRFRRYCAIEEGLSIRTVHSMRTTIKTFVRRTRAESLGEITTDLLRELTAAVPYWCRATESNSPLRGTVT